MSSPIGKAIVEQGSRRRGDRADAERPARVRDLKLVTIHDDSRRISRRSPTAVRPAADPYSPATRTALVLTRHRRRRRVSRRRAPRAGRSGREDRRRRRPRHRCGRRAVCRRSTAARGCGTRRALAAPRVARLYPLAADAASSRLGVALAAVVRRPPAGGARGRARRVSVGAVARAIGAGGAGRARRRVYRARRRRVRARRRCRRGCRGCRARPGRRALRRWPLPPRALARGGERRQRGGFWWAALARRWATAGRVDCRVGVVGADERRRRGSAEPRTDRVWPGATRSCSPTIWDSRASASC